MPGLNLPDLFPGFVDIGALMSAPLPAAQPTYRGPPEPIDIPDIVPDPHTAGAKIAARLRELGGDKYEPWARRLELMSITAPQAVAWVERRGFTREDIDTTVRAYAIDLPGAGAAIDYSMIFSTTKEGHHFWGTLLDHLRYQRPLPDPDTFDLPPLPTKQWEVREAERFAAGSYFPLPWADDVPAIPRHYAHISTADPTMVSYTPDDTKGHADRQVRTKPGRYLAKFYPDMAPDDVRKYAAMLDAAFTQLHYATTEDEIEDVYVNGPQSCMSYSADHFSSPVHPVRVYAAGDLAVAYTKQPCGKISGRCLVWPDKKLRGRIYGDLDRMKLLLAAAGYDEDESDLEGAKLLRIRAGSGFVMPYIDNIGEFTDDGKHLYIGYGDSATNTNGLSSSGTYCPRLDDYVGDDEGDFTYIEDAGECWSPLATERYAFFCERSRNHYSDDIPSHEVRVRQRTRYNGNTYWATETWSDNAVGDHAWHCETTDQWYSDDVAGAVVIGIDGPVCPDWAALNCTVCAVSGDLYETSELVENKDGELVHPDHIEEDADTAAAT